MNYPSSLVSVLIPTYDVVQYVEIAIRSIMKQTYENLEIIIVDDCSQDGTYEILQGLANEDDRIKLYRNAQNMNIVYSLNFALSKSNGEYIARMDGDDISLPNRIAEQINYIKINPQVDLVGSNVSVIDENGQFIYESKYPEHHSDIVKAAKFVSPILHIWLAKKSVYDTLKEYRIRTVEDYDFVLRAIDSGFVLANCQLHLYLQRMRTGNTATSSGLIQYKLRRFVQKLAKERKYKKIDTYSIHSLDTIVKSSFLERFSFRVSSSYHFKYIKYKRRNFLLAIFYRGVSILCSPKKQLLEIYSRRRYKSIMKEYLS